jgi:hypothetical protein
MVNLNSDEVLGDHPGLASASASPKNSHFVVAVQSTKDAQSANYENTD